MSLQPLKSVKRAAGTALSVIVVLFDHNESLSNHRDTSTLEQYPILSCTISVMPRETLKHTARGSAHASEPKSRRKVHVENVHEVELPKDPMIVVGCGELVARELAAREHHPAAKTTAAPTATYLLLAALLYSLEYSLLTTRHSPLTPSHEAKIVAL